MVSLFFFFKQKPVYEMRISDWSSNVCSSDLSAGYAMVFDYNGNGDATAACIFNRSQTYVTASSTCSGAALKTGYGYTTISSKVYLTSATDVLGNTTTYTQSVYGGENGRAAGRGRVCKFG